MSVVHAAKIIDLGMRVLRGELDTPESIGLALAGLALDLAPVEKLKEHLTEAARLRDDAIVDQLEILATS